MDPLAPKVARRYLAATPAGGVIDEDDLRALDLRALDPEDAREWKGYELRLIHHTYTKEEWAESLEPATRQEHKGPFPTLEGLLRALSPLKFDTWLATWLTGKPVKTPKQVQQVDAEPTRKDGRRLSREELDFISNRLKIR